MSKTTPRLIRAYRDRLGLSQSQMAAHIGMPMSSYIKIEQGTRRADDQLLISLLRDLLRDPLGDQAAL